MDWRVKCFSLLLLPAVLVFVRVCGQGRCVPPEVPCGNPEGRCVSRSCVRPLNRVVKQTRFRGECYCPFEHLVNNANECVPVNLCDETNNAISAIVNSVQLPQPNPIITPNVQQPIYPNPPVIQPVSPVQTIVQPLVNQGIQPPFGQPLNQGLVSTNNNLPVGSLSAVTGQVVPAQTFTNILTDLGPDPFLYQMYNPVKYDHLLTRSKKEINDVIIQGYRLEKELGRMITNASSLAIQCPILVPLTRWFQPLVSDHYYTTKPNDTTRLIPNGYVRETDLGLCVNGIACGATVPLHQFYNDQLKNHYYTTYLQDFEKVINRTEPGYQYEGVACYIWE